LDETENLYRLRLAELKVPDQLASGQLRGRRLEPGDAELVTDWWVAYSVEVLGEEDTPQLLEAMRDGFQRRLEERKSWILEDGGRRVSMSGFNMAIREAVQVGGVYTPPPLRSRGYGRAAVAASLLDARDEGVEMSILFTGIANIAAQRAYTALGFEHIGDYRLLLLRESLRLFE
jgi:predicted GNAT family acetyltransferase